MSKETQVVCAYCNRPEIRAREIAGNELAWAFPTNIPITEGHTLISPRRCVASLMDLEKQEVIEVLALARRMMICLRKEFGAVGFNCAWNEGILAGQNVPHFHLHVIPRREGDTGLLGFDPRSLLYRTGDREPTEEAILLRLRDRLSTSYKGHSMVNALTTALARGGGVVGGVRPEDLC